VSWYIHVRLIALCATRKRPTDNVASSTPYEHEREILIDVWFSQNMRAHWLLDAAWSHKGTPIWFGSSLASCDLQQDFLAPIEIPLRWRIRFSKANPRTWSMGSRRGTQMTSLHQKSCAATISGVWMPFNVGNPKANQLLRHKDLPGFSAVLLMAEFVQSSNSPI
jgi:hypothetical protein